MSTESEGLWVYGILDGASANQRVAGVVGVAGEEIRSIQVGGIAAAVGTVPLAEFGEDALRQNLENLDWLDDKARAHDRVVSRLAQSGSVIPLRMTTVYLTEQGVADLLVDHCDQFAATLDAVNARQELGVKAYADAHVLMGTAHPDSSSSSKPSGTAYLLRRRRELSAQEDAYRLADEAAQRIHAELMGYAVAGRRKKTTDHSISGPTGWVVLNGTYLVDNSRTDLFRRTVAALQADLAGIKLDVTGPWPPYSFTGDLARP